MNDVSLAERQERIDREKAEKEAAEKRLQAQKAAAQKAVEQRKADLAQIAKIEREAQIGLMDDKQGELAKLEDTYKEQLALYEKRGQDHATLTEYYEQQKQAIIDKYEQERKDKEAEAAQAEIDARTDRSAALLAALDKQLQDELNLYDQQAIASQEQLAKNYSEENVEKAKKQMETVAMAAGASLAGIAVLGPVGIVAGAFVNGKNIDLKAGTELYIQTKADTTLYGIQTTAQ